MRFQDIKGHAQTKEQLRRMVDSGRIPHAILLEGEQGIGKMLLARALASYIVCTDKHDGDSCGRCSNCIQMKRLNHPDIHYIYPTVKPKGAKSVVSTDWLEQWRKMLNEYPWMQPETWQDLMSAGNSQSLIPVSESEQLTHAASLSAYVADYKIFIIWQPEKMNIETANKILKLLEEPFEDTIFIFVSNEAGRLLPTIYSRLQRIEVKRLSDGELTELLESEGYDPSTAVHLARLSQGRPGVAESLSSVGSESREFNELFRGSMRAAYARKPWELKIISEKIAEMGREKSMRLYDYFSSQIRENFIYNLQTPELVMMTPEELQFSTKFAPFIHSGNVEQLSELCTRTKRSISQNANNRIIGFDFMLQLMVLLRKKRQ